MVEGRDRAAPQVGEVAERRKARDLEWPALDPHIEEIEDADE